MKKGWVETTLGGIGNVAMCKRIFKEETTATGDIPFYKIGTFGRKPDAYISSHTYSEYRAKYPFPKRGDVLISASGTIGRRVRYDGEPAYFQDSNIVWIDNDEKKVLNDYLYHFYGACEWNSTKGATISRLYNEDLRRIVIAFPESHQEQQRIVGVLDEAFDGLARATTNAEQNLRNARALFESHLQSVFTRRSDEVQLSDLASEITDGDHSPPPKASTGVPFITISDIVKRTRDVDFSNTFMVPVEYFQKLKPNKKPRVGDILYTVTGATLGIPVLVKEQRDFCFQRHIGLVRPKPDTDSAWLTYAMLSPQVFNQATIGSTGAAQKTVSLSVLRGLKVPKLALSKQKHIAAQLDSIATETQRLESIYRQKLAALGELKQSLLHQAFSGKL